MAHVAFQLKDYVAMQDACEKVIIIDSHLIEAYHLYAQACTSQNDMVNAIAMATKAIMLFENEAVSYAKAADLYLLHGRDRKSTRLNSSHANISYAVFCLK